MDLDQSTPTDVETMKGKLSDIQRKQEIEDSTTAFAFEDTEGNLVKVHVDKEQAENFKKELAALLDDAEHQDLEIAEVIYRLHQKYNIINVEWCEGSIPEDEEVKDPNAPIESNADAEAKGFPDPEAAGDVAATDQGTPDDLSAEPGAEDGADPMAADGTSAPVDVNAEVSKMAMLNKVLGLLQARTDADRAKAEAEKAKADVEASRVAAQAAAQYASSQEELMDMENYNKRAQEDKREATLQSKLIRYRHDLRKQSTASLEDKLKDPDFLLNMLAKAHNAEKLGESMTNPIIATPPSPEEEELLHAEDWEKEQSEKQKAEKNRERLLRYRHARRKARQPTAEGAVAAAVEGEAESKEDTFTGISDIKKARFSDFLKANGFKAFAKHVAQNS